MKALQFKQAWDVKKINYEPLEINEPNDVIVDVMACGICGTDIGIITGSYDAAIPEIILGHEAAGIVSKIGSKVSKFNIGDRVVINPTYSCGVCRMCNNGNANHCERKNGTEAGVSYNGAFSNNYKAKEDYLIKLDDKISFEEASFTEPLSCVITGIDKLCITHTNIRSIVVGAGPMGMLYLWALYNKGVQSCLIENNDHRYNFASKILPPNTKIYKNIDEAIQKEYGSSDNKIDLCVDTTGRLIESVFKKLARGGKILNIALKDMHANFDLLEITDKSLSIIGSIDSLNNSFERAYKMILNGEVPVNKLISHVFSLEDYIKAFKTVGCDLEQKKLTMPIEDNCKVIIKLKD